MFKNNIKDLDELYTIIGKNVKYYREKKNLTQEDLSKELGYKSISTISCSEIYYKKKVKFNIKQLYKISNMLDIPIELFFIKRK